MYEWQANVNVGVVGATRRSYWFWGGHYLRSWGGGVKVVDADAEPEPDVEPDAEPDVGFNETGNPPVAGFGTYNGLVP